MNFSAAVDSNNYRGKNQIVQNESSIRAENPPKPRKFADFHVDGFRGSTLEPADRVQFMAFEMTDDEFERLAERALDEIPANLLALMDNVVIFIEDSYTPMPGEAPDTKLLGLYEGTSLTERDGGWDAGALPDRITIYKDAILEICSSEKQVVEEVGITVVHEIAHHFGIDDQRLHELGWG